MLSSLVLTEGCSSFPNSEGRRPGDRGAPYRALLLPLLPLLLLLPAPECQPAAPASSSAVRVVAARPRVSTKAHFYEAGQWRFRGCRAAGGAPGQGRAGRVRSALPVVRLCSSSGSGPGDGTGIAGWSSSPRPPPIRGPTPPPPCPVAEEVGSAGTIFTQRAFKSPLNTPLL